MKRVIFIFGLMTLAMTGFSYVPPVGGCSNKPSLNSGVCQESTSNGNVSYHCVDSSWYQSNNCVK